MKLYYNPTDGQVFYTVYDRDIFQFQHTTNIPLSQFEIDETEGNPDLLVDD